jgi:hypothetical protein
MKTKSCAVLTKNGRGLARELFTRGLIDADGLWLSGDGLAVGGICSLIARHSVTMRNLSEIKCGNETHSGEWVNENIDWLNKREEQTAFRLGALVDQLNEYTTKKLHLDWRGDPRGLVVRFAWVDDRGYTCEVGVN